jgi:F-type H+-transporting ATPase subunit delta
VSRVVDHKGARRYASALFAAASRAGKTDRVEEDLRSLRTLWESSPRIPEALESPLVPADRKVEVIDKVLARELDSLTAEFLRLLVHKRREQILLAVDEEYRLRLDDARGLVRAQAVVAVPIDDTQRSGLVSGLSQRTGKQIELSIDVDPGIIGGVVVRLGDTVIDGSVRGALERLREQMLTER